VQLQPVDKINKIYFSKQKFKIYFYIYHSKLLYFENKVSFDKHSAYRINLNYDNGKRRLSFWEIWNMSFGFLGIQMGLPFKMLMPAEFFKFFGADVHELSWF
jgi:hypothetical protein